MMDLSVRLAIFPANYQTAEVAPVKLLFGSPVAIQLDFGELFVEQPEFAVPLDCLLELVICSIQLLDID